MTLGSALATLTDKKLSLADLSALAFVLTLVASALMAAHAHVSALVPVEASDTDGSGSSDGSGTDAA